MRILLLLCLALPALGFGVDQRITDGNAAIIGNNPHSLSLRVEGAHTCGASLISTTRAVTAAQCAGQPIGVYSLLGGTVERTVTNCATCVLADVNFISIHPFYFPDPTTGFQNDVAVLGFDTIQFNDNLNSIPLADPDSGDFAGASCVATGWGATEAGGAFDDDLQRGEFTVQTNSACESSWGEGQIAVVHLCGYGAGQVSICDGDQGGPLECGGELAGISSWHEVDCSASYPSVFTRVSTVQAWIIDQ
jgi:secreted trypsin-like serine protease